MTLVDNFFTISQAAEFCGVDRATMTHWVRDRQVGRQQVGREVLIPKDQVEVLKDIRSLEDVIRDAAKNAGLPTDSHVQVRLNSILMANNGRTVVELYDPSGPRTWMVEVSAQELTS